jgi:hypothetical protein
LSAAGGVAREAGQALDGAGRIALTTLLSILLLDAGVHILLLHLHLWHVLLQLNLLIHAVGMLWTGSISHLGAWWWWCGVVERTRRVEVAWAREGRGLWAGGVGGRAPGRRGRESGGKGGL